MNLEWCVKEVLFENLEHCLNHEARGWWIHGINHIKSDIYHVILYRERPETKNEIHP